MRKLGMIIAVLFLLAATPLHNKENTVLLKHTNYTSTYNKDLCYPIVVEWWETKDKVECVNKLKRKDNFAPDPLLPKETDLGKDYVGSGFDRGHMCPTAINLCQGPAVQNECFYFSNMSAQYGSLNRGDWKSLETLTRNTAVTMDSIHIWCGNVGAAKKIGSVTVPTQCWKVYYVKKTNMWYAFLFNNTPDKADGIENNAVNIEVIENLTGLTFR